MGVTNIRGNPNGLITEPKFNWLDGRWGHRALHFRAYRCPNGRCALCEWDRNDRVGDTGWHYKAPPIKEFSVTLTRLADDPNRPELLEHVYRKSPVVISYVPDQCFPDVKQNFYEGDHFSTDAREINWFDNVAQPPKGGQYVATYTAYEEVEFYMAHVNATVLGGSKDPEMGKLMPFGDMDNGTVGISVPSTSPAFHFKAGDYFVFVDSEMSFDVTIDILSPQRYSRHKFITYIEHAFTLQEDRDNHDPLLVDVYEFPDNAILYSDEDRLFKFDETLAPPYAKTVTITYRARPEYMVYLDAGSFRSPKQGKMPRAGLLARREST